MTCFKSKSCLHLSVFPSILSLPGPSRPHRLLVFINPYGGKKKAKQIYHSSVAPLFELAGISSHVVGKRHATPLRYLSYQVSLSLALKWHTVGLYQEVGRKWSQVKRERQRKPDQLLSWPNYSRNPGCTSCIGCLFSEKISAPSAIGSELIITWWQWWVYV